VYAVTEYQAGGTLRQLLNSTTLVLPWKLRLAMVADVAKAVHYLHEKGVTHGAIRSASALVDLNGRLRLSDVGLARRYSNAPRADDSRYAAPEALTNAVYSPPGDAFSFGVLLWEIMHRRDAPFRRADDNYSAEALLEWPTPEGAMPELPLLLARCLAHDAAARPGFDDIVPRVRAMLVTSK
jgi:serine/threonine protein kinase